MTTRVSVQPTLLTWALARARRTTVDLPTHLKAVPKWLAGELEPTFNQLEALAAWTHTPVGYFFLDEPPLEPVPIPDFRTLKNQSVTHPSADLLDTIYQCQDRQEWYREYALAEDFEPLAFVGSMPSGTPAIAAAEAIRETLNWEVAQREECRTPDDARRMLIGRIEDLGVLVMVNGVVGANTHRVLDPNEFRGLALVDDLAPLIFVNGADSKSAQVFTLIHELAHVWSGETALSDADMTARVGHDQEMWANKVAAEVLVPSGELAERWARYTASELAAHFKVSELVVLTSAFDTKLIEWGDYRSRYDKAVAGIAQNLADHPAASGGDFYKSQPYRLSRRFARAVVTDTREGRTLYRDAYALLGVAKHSTFENLAEAVLA